MYNLQYGNLKKTEEDVHNAARLADLHESILSWPAGYETQVPNSSPVSEKLFQSSMGVEKILPILRGLFLE